MWTSVAPVSPKHSCAQPSTCWPDVSTFCDSFSDKTAQVGLKCGRVYAPALHHATVAPASVSTTGRIAATSANVYPLNARFQGQNDGEHSCDA